jgi:hypothetical protein
MTGFAALAAVLSVDMEIMQIPISVPEPRCIRGRGKSEQVPVMAAETQRKFGVTIGHVELRRVGFQQEPVVGCAMRIVARSALPVFDRAVEHGLGFFNEILVAIEAKFHACLLQELGRIARMRRMA